MVERGVASLTVAMLEQCRHDILQKDYNTRAKQINLITAVEFMISDWYEELTGFDGVPHLQHLLNERRELYAEQYEDECKTDERVNKEEL